MRLFMESEDCATAPFFVLPSAHALISPEEQRNRAGAGMAADGGAHAVNLHLTVQLWKAFLYQTATACASSMQSELEI